MRLNLNIQLYFISNLLVRMKLQQFLPFLNFKKEKILHIAIEIEFRIFLYEVENERMKKAINLFHDDSITFRMKRVTFSFLTIFHLAWSSILI